MDQLDFNAVLERLKARGHQVGLVGVSPEGHMVASVDLKMLTYDEAVKLLEKQPEDRDGSS